MKRNYLLLLTMPAALYVACKGKQKNDFLPVKSFIESQVRHVDSTLYSIIKAEKTGTDSTWDTSYVKREDFHNLAKDFLDIPDITSLPLGNKYKEEKLYDDQLKRVIIVYTAIKEDLEIMREEVVIAPGDTAFDKMTSIIIEKIKDYKDSSIHQHLLWQTDEKFQVVTIIEKNGRPVFTKSMEVTWNPQIYPEDTPAAPDSAQADPRSGKDSLIEKKKKDK
jgi:hypothetical protein